MVLSQSSHTEIPTGCKETALHISTFSSDLTDGTVSTVPHLVLWRLAFHKSNK